MSNSNSLTSPPAQRYNSYKREQGQLQQQPYTTNCGFYTNQLTPPPSIKQENSIKTETSSSSNSTSSGTSSPQHHLPHRSNSRSNLATGSNIVPSADYLYAYQQQHAQQHSNSTSPQGDSQANQFSSLLHNPYHSLAFAAAVVQQSLQTSSRSPSELTATGNRNGSSPDNAAKSSSSPQSNSSIPIVSGSA